MVAHTITTPSKSAQVAVADINAISMTLSPLLAAYGEQSLVAGVAHAIGVQRILEIAAKSNAPTFACEEALSEPADADKPYNYTTYYAAGCTGAKHLHTDLGRCIFKKGYTTDEGERLIGLNNAAYGGWSATQPTLDPDHPGEGWSDWAFEPYRERDVSHIALPAGVTIVAGLFRVRLPHWCTPREFDRIVTAAMMPRQLTYWAMSGEGRAHCAMRGLDPRDFIRFSRDMKTGLLRPVEELYVYSLRHDAQWFATILGDALAHVRKLDNAH